MLYKCIIKEKYIQLFEFVKPKLLKYTCLVNTLVHTHNLHFNNI